MIELSIIGAISAFSTGIISFLSPCVLPLVPGYISYIGGYSLAGKERDNRQYNFGKSFPTLTLSLSFVLGYSTIFMVFGASASTLGRWPSFTGHCRRFIDIEEIFGLGEPG